MTWKNLAADIAEEFGAGADEREWHEALVLEQRHAHARAWRQKNPQRWRAIQQRYFAKHRDAILARRRARRVNDPRIRASEKASRARNAERVRARARERYAQLRTDPVWVERKRAQVALHKERIRARDRERYARLRADALCVICEKALARENRTDCAACAAARNARAKPARAQRRANDPIFRAKDVARCKAWRARKWSAR